MIDATEYMYVKIWRLLLMSVVIDLLVEERL